MANPDGAGPWPEGGGGDDDDGGGCCCGDFSANHDIGLSAAF